MQDRARTPRLVFLTSPNNPTGDLYRSPKNWIESAGWHARDRSLLVLDEALYRVLRRANRPASLVDASYPQLVVLRTLSKAWASAGLRCGAVIAHPGCHCAYCSRVMAPYPLSAPGHCGGHGGQRMKAFAPGNGPYVGHAGRGQTCDLLEAARKPGQLGAENLARRGQLRPGAGPNDGPALVALLRIERGVRLRDFGSQPMLDHCVRLTVGAAEKDMAGAGSEALKAYGEGQS